MACTLQTESFPSAGGLCSSLLYIFSQTLKSPRSGCAPGRGARPLRTPGPYHEWEFGPISQIGSTPCERVGEVWG